ncbi:hypothetical protein ACFIJ5_14620 [Haloimpatiens sp. FM7330]|uniref:hypothetical protein n=1 Tax=Haloimpatiens sp. FM7330 TaxID=3298610 RepID=UPI0036304968
MLSLIKAEIKKSGLKISLFILWAITLWFAPKIITYFPGVTINELYSDLFYKFYGITPLLGLIMFIICSGAYTKEYSSGMFSLINTTKMGKKHTVTAKWIASGIMASVINLSVFGAMFFSVASKAKFQGLNLPLKELWYFGKSGSSITVVQLILITCVTLILGSFIFTQIGLVLSSMSKSAVVPFLVGGFIMGLPYLAENIFRGMGIAKYLGLTPLWGMCYGQLIRYKTPFAANIFLIILFAASMIIIPKVTYKAFTNENRK